MSPDPAYTRTTCRACRGEVLAVDLNGQRTLLDARAKVWTMEHCYDSKTTFYAPDSMSYVEHAATCTKHRTV